MVHDTGMGGVTLERGDITFKRWGEFPILFGHMMGRQPGNGVPCGILVFKGLLELLEEVVPAFKGYGGVRDGVFSEGVCPGQD